MKTLHHIKNIECGDTMQHTAGFSKEDNEMVAKMQVQDLLPFALVLVVVGIVIAFGLQVQGDVAEDFTADSIEANATLDAQEGVANLSEKLPTIGLIGGIVVVITLLVGGFMSLRSN